MVADARAAWAFLTRLPGGRHPADGAAFARSIWWFGPVGLVVGVVPAAVWWLAHPFWWSTPVAVLAVAAGMAATGAIHEDGLADTLDGLGGGRDREHRLEIMRDSRVGTFGVLGLGLVVIGEVASLAPLGREVGALALIVAFGLGRSVASHVVRFVPPARADGLGASAGGGRRAVEPVAAAAAIAVFGVSGVIMVLTALAVGFGISTWALRRIGGATGDVAGAAGRLAQTAVLYVAAGREVPLAPWLESLAT